MIHLLLFEHSLSLVTLVTQGFILTPDARKLLFNEIQLLLGFAPSSVLALKILNIIRC